MFDAGVGLNIPPYTILSVAHSQQCYHDSPLRKGAGKSINVQKYFAMFSSIKQ
jgi:hypothetical protein